MLNRDVAVPQDGIRCFDDLARKHDGLIIASWETPRNAMLGRTDGGLMLGQSLERAGRSEKREARNAKMNERGIHGS
jgi:hypothetical protein